jgi:D-alanyl-D-alanine carboxypeptidase
MTNHNHLLGKIPGVDGLKTGFTSGAGFCLAATAERERPPDHRGHDGQPRLRGPAT